MKEIQLDELQEDDVVRLVGEIDPSLTQYPMLISKVNYHWYGQELKDNYQAMAKVAKLLPFMTLRHAHILLLNEYRRDR